MKTASERAMALADGQLAPAEVPGLVQELGRNPALVAELQIYLATAKRRLGEPYEAKGDEPVPARLVDTALQAPASAEQSAPPLTYLRMLMEQLRRSYRVPAWSLAAGSTLPGALIAVALVMPSRGQDSSVEASLGSALERAESGKDAGLVSLRPVLSFKSKEASWCRQYEIRYTARQVSHGLACRAKGGQWNVVSSTSPGPIGLMPAGSDPRRAIDDRVTATLAEQPLSKADEAVIMGKGWPRP